MIPLLPKWHLMPNRPSFYDTDSKTLLELSSTLHSAMNNLIEDYNKFVDSVNNKITEFTESETQNREVFEVAIRQEFQDFINTVDLKLGGFRTEMNNYKTAMDSKYSGFTSGVNTTIAGMQRTLQDTIANMEQITIDTVNQAIADGRIVVGVVYNDETEEMNIIANGGVE